MMIVITDAWRDMIGNGGTTRAPVGSLRASRGIKKIVASLRQATTAEMNVEFAERRHPGTRGRFSFNRVDTAADIVRVLRELPDPKARETSSFGSPSSTCAGDRQGSPRRGEETAR